VSSFWTSTTATWPPLIGVGAGEIDGVVTVVLMVAVAAAATCCGSAAEATLCGASPVAVTALPITRGALVERRLVGTDVSSLSALAGSRGGGQSAPLCEREIEKIKLTALETECLEERLPT
jgi:hypothetical protein